MLATTPSPPYTAVIFTSVRTADEETIYTTMADDMERQAERQPGYLGIESARDPTTRLGITVSYWRTAADAAAWKQVSEHLVAQELGRTRWYECYEVRVATVERAYGT